MSRVFEDRAYEADSLNGCFWAEDFPGPDYSFPALQSEQSCDVAVIGAGYTGLSAALHLAEGGANVAVLDMHAPGWGASGRNGGFCCLGGAMAGDRSLRRRFGPDGLAEWDRAQSDAVDLVASLIRRHGITADIHSNGETQLAHSARSYQRLERKAERLAKTGQPVEFIATSELAAKGMQASGLLGGLTEPRGFALHPRKYVLGLAGAALSAGARVFSKAPVRRITAEGAGFRLHSTDGSITCKRLVVATNGYSRDDVPQWLRARFMPVQSNILVTRKLTDQDLAAQGWTTGQMVYDTRKLLHYFRLLPDGRMMFGMRGGIWATKAHDRKMHAMIRRDFEKMFPAWADVETPWFWTGLVCLTGRRVPYVGPVDGMDGAFAGFGWHGNGIAMGTYAGRMLARLALGQGVDIPRVMRGRPLRMPLGKHRRMLLPPIYKGLAVRDWLA